MSGRWDNGPMALGKSWLANFAGLRNMSKLLTLIAAVSVSVVFLFSFTEAGQYLSIVPVSSHAHGSSYASESSNGSGSPQESQSSRLSKSSHVSHTADVAESAYVPDDAPTFESFPTPTSAAATAAATDFMSQTPDALEGSESPVSEPIPNIPPPKVWDVDGWPVPKVPPPPVRKDRRFVILLPATSPSQHLCKTIFTALALGYPAPIIIGWGMDYRAISQWKSGANMMKIPAVLNYLDSALHPGAHPSEKLENDDIVIIADGYDVWFQLTPEILLKRYHEINEKANARLLEQWRGPWPMPMEQTIIAGSEKNCWPRPYIGSDLQCPFLPDSPIRKDLYGPDTDKTQDVKKHLLRPRYINGGVYIGQAGDIRRWFRRTHGQMIESINKGTTFMRSEQGVTGQVFGEQEVWRQWLRETNAPPSSAMSLMQRDFEYHIGLDYFQAINVQTHDSGDDGRIIKLSNQTEINRFSEEQGISPVRLQGLPDDIKVARNPLTGFVENPDWNEMPLYADVFTESVPVILHHNGQKERRDGWWHLPWFFKYLRQMVEHHLVPRDPRILATVQTEDGLITYRPLDAEKLGRRPRMMKDSTTQRLPEAEFNAICGAPNEPWWDEIFRDGKKGLSQA